MWDAIRLEKSGVAAPVVVHDVFAEAARRQAIAGGVPDLRLLVYPQPPPGETDAQALASAERVGEAVQDLVDTH